MPDQNDRTVALRGPEDSMQGMRMVGTHVGIGGVKQGVPQFTKVNDYTTFWAEYALIDGDVVVHFFRPWDHKVTRKYWQETFAEVLDSVAQEHFQATKPRLVARYTEDDGAGNQLHSWWFKAQQFDHILDLPKFMLAFFSKIDEKMDPHLPPRTE